MAVGVLAGEDVFVQGERAEVGVVLKEALGELAIAGAGSPLVGEVEVFGEGVGLVPCPGDVLVWAGGHLGAIEGFGGEERQDGVGGAIESGERLRILGELMCVDEAAVRFVEGVGGDAVVLRRIFC